MQVSVPMIRVTHTCTHAHTHTHTHTHTYIYIYSVSFSLYDWQWVNDGFCAGGAGWDTVRTTVGSDRDVSRDSAEGLLQCVWLVHLHGQGKLQSGPQCLVGRSLLGHHHDLAHRLRVRACPATGTATPAAKTGKCSGLVNPLGPRPAAALSLWNPLRREVTVSNDSGMQL